MSSEILVQSKMKALGIECKRVAFIGSCKYRLTIPMAEADEGEAYDKSTPIYELLETNGFRPHVATVGRDKELADYVLTASVQVLL